MQSSTQHFKLLNIDSRFVKKIECIIFVLGKTVCDQAIKDYTTIFTLI